MILVGDVGGSRTRLAFAERDGDGWRFSHLEQFPTTPAIEDGIRRLVADAGGVQPVAAAFCGAGPVAANGTIQLTNAGVLLDPAALGRAAGLSRALLVNDFAAIAAAIPDLPHAALVPCGGGTAAPDAPRIVMGPGTGLGAATLVPAGVGWTVVAGEGGHTDLAPTDEEELHAWRLLRERHGRVSAETVLSGPGLARLYEALAPGESKAPPEIAEAAWRGEPRAARAVLLFTRWLGRVAGDLALIAGARGGVYLAGGFVPAWGGGFDVRAFREGFEDKPPYEEWLRAVPGFIVRHAQPGLLGLAVSAARILAAGDRRH